ncbi:MAG: hypothetical protein ABSG04_06780 [Verrucomicrobiota bacterium]|jgi:hypothetical protein
MNAQETKFVLVFMLGLAGPVLQAQLVSSNSLPMLQLSRVQPGITFISPNTFSHQGYATDGTNHFTFNNQAIYVWSNDLYWTSIASNTAVFAGTTGMNHLGDGDYYNGKLYVVAENWASCGNYTNQSLLTFDALTLQRLSVHNVAADAHEVSGLAVAPSDGSNGIIYVTSYCDGSKLWEYDLSSFALIGTLPLSQNILTIQGITWANRIFYIAQDNGNIYSIDYNGHVSLVYTSTIPGSHEGLKYVQGQIRWLIDSGPGHKFIYYVNLDSVVVAMPATAAGWILEASTNCMPPWVPVTAGALTTTAEGVSLSFQPPSPSAFYRLRQP